MKGAVGASVVKGLRAAWDNLPAIVALEGAMGGLVASYYFWPAAHVVLARFAAWQQAGGVPAAALAAGLAGGVLSEVSVVYSQEGGRWSRGRLENALFKFVLFFVNGAAVFEFYQAQGVWFGHQPSWHTILPKVLIDQFVYTVLWSVPFQGILARWHALGFSWPRLQREMNNDFIRGRLLPVLITNWMLWLPGVSFVYAMPQNLQMPLSILGNAIWSLLLSATADVSHRQTTGTVADLMQPEALPQID